MVEGAQARREALAVLHAFVVTRNAAALASLDEASESLIILQINNLMATLHLSLRSTHAIENRMRRN